MVQYAVEIAKQVANFGVQSAYGEAQQLDGTTIIPVALVVSGFGGGGESETGANGGGGGSYSIPLGVYVKDEDRLRFRPNIIPLLVVGVPFVCVAGRALSRVIRALKK